MRKYAKSLWERYENHAIYDTPSPRKKPKPIPTESEVAKLNYSDALRASVANRTRLTR